MRTNYDIWKHTTNSINSWKNERKDLIVSYCKLLNIHPMPDNIKLVISDKKDLNITHQKDLPFHEQLLEFRQDLIDYVTIGHFSIFEKIFEAQEQAKAEKVILESKYFKKILKSTNAALDFDSKYSKLKNLKEIKETKNFTQETKKKYEELQKDLTDLMIKLEDRFKLEDKLVNHYLSFKPKPPAPKQSKRMRL